LHGIQRYRPAGRLDAYLLRIARNLWIDSRRKKRPISAGENLPDGEAPGETPIESLDRRDRAMILRTVLAQSGSATQELIELAVLQQLPYQDVAEILNIPVGTVKSRVHYALKKLRETASILNTNAESGEGT
jgi:RNA polymerase sigma-70 factor (ECF subfamily)